MSSSPPPVIVWGNCQAEPLATLLEQPLAAAGWQVVHLPPVFLIDEEALARVQNEILPRAAALISQPVRDEYRLSGCGTAQLAERLTDDARLVTIPNTYDTSGFPYQVDAHRGDGSRIDAPLTDYHDLRAIVAAERGLTVDEALAWWPAPTAEMVTTNAASSKAELHRREEGLDVRASDLLDGPAMFTLSHPTNATLVEIARRIVAALDISTPPDIAAPEREFLGARRAPIEAAVVEALGWSESARHDNWVVNQREVPQRELLETHLGFYAEHPDIVIDARSRFAARLALLDL
jgi:hypothetical protein